MSPRKIKRREIKKRISQAKSLRKNLPRYIDCSSVYGDNTFTELDYDRVDKMITEFEQELKDFDAANPVT